MIRTTNILKRIRSRRAFTLIEMTIVVLVISILFAIAVPAYMRFRESSKATVCQTSLRQIQSAKERWAMDNKKRDSDTPAMSDIIPNYIKTTPSCPSGGIYDVRPVGESPRCSTAGSHVID